jgi:hypothetical protein
MAGQMFDSFDTEKRGTLSHTSILALLAKIGKEVSFEDIKYYIHQESEVTRNTCTHISRKFLKEQMYVC